MDGARGDLESHFGSPVDINAAVAARGDETSSEAAAPHAERTPLLVKAAGASDWAPLLVAVSETA